MFASFTTYSLVVLETVLTSVALALNKPTIAKNERVNNVFFIITNLVATNI
jgi:hypothetical protein